MVGTVTTPVSPVEPRLTEDKVTATASFVNYATNKPSRGLTL